MNARLQPAPGTMVTPGLELPDPLAARRLAEVNLRLRREVAWCWHLRTGRPDPLDGTLPPVFDPTVENLDRVRFRAQRARFDAEDPAARHLGEALAALPGAVPAPGSAWHRAVQSLGLDHTAELALALAMAQRLDAALAPVFATCMNDLSRPWPTPALLQRLADEPLAAVALAGTDHALLRHGLLLPGEGEWQRPLAMPAVVAQVLAGLVSPADAPGLAPVAAAAPRRLDAAGERLAARLGTAPASALEVVPLRGAPGAAFADWALALAGSAGVRLLAVDAAAAAEPSRLAPLLGVAWLGGFDLLLPASAGEGPAAAPAWEQLPLSVPVRCYLPVTTNRETAPPPPAVVLPALELPTLDHAERRRLLADGLGRRARRLEPVVEECARRFRLPEQTLRRVAADVAAMPAPDGEALLEACRGAARADLGDLARRVVPRFRLDEMVLPAAIRRQLDEVVTGMRMLTRVHYGWGTARAWNESGLSVLFCGPPGTGKTMAAEALADELALDMFRVDLSQVVNKYIGETEKNLARIFDAAERSDVLLFFDEADALFGKRTEVKDAHDRFANIEVSYLLERMERFKGLALLASNRRKDLDEAFARRLRYVVEFPVPGVDERERLWRESFPPAVDTSGVEFRWLARQFVLSGGHIRSVAFNTCLQAAGAGDESACVTMPQVLVQVKRELAKLDRATGAEQFGVWADAVAGAEARP